MKSTNCDKMIFAILQNDNYRDVIAELNRHGFYVTVLHSSGGFLKEPNSTVMVGVNSQYLDEAISLLKKFGKRTEIEYKPATSTAGLGIPPMMMTPLPFPVHRGGIVLFVMDVVQFERI